MDKQLWNFLGRREKWIKGENLLDVMMENVSKIGSKSWTNILTRTSSVEIQIKSIMWERLPDRAFHLTYGNNFPGMAQDKSRLRVLR